MHLSNYLYIYICSWMIYIIVFNELHIKMSLCIYWNVNEYIIPLVILSIERSIENDSFITRWCGFILVKHFYLTAHQH